MDITKIKKITKVVFIFFIVVIILLSFDFVFAKKPILYHFYTVDKLTEIFYENESNKYQFNGAICNDGWISHSQGRGTCSWHGVVDYYFYIGEYKKTKEECKKDAKRFSWIE